MRRMAIVTHSRARSQVNNRDQCITPKLFTSLRIQPININSGQTASHRQRLLMPEITCTGTAFCFHVAYPRRYGGGASATGSLPSPMVINELNATPRPCLSFRREGRSWHSVVIRAGRARTCTCWPICRSCAIPRNMTATNDDGKRRRSDAAGAFCGPSLLIPVRLR